MEKQHTVAQSVQFNGITLHMGVRATLRINPGEIDSGIWFRRIDVPGAPMVKAVATNVVDVRRGTTIASGNAAVATVEHVMSALHAAESTMQLWIWMDRNLQFSTAHLLNFLKVY